MTDHAPETVERVKGELSHWITPVIGRMILNAVDGKSNDVEHKRLTVALENAARAALDAMPTIPSQVSRSGDNVTVNTESPTRTVESVEELEALATRWEQPCSYEGDYALGLDTMARQCAHDLRSALASPTPREVPAVSAGMDQRAAFDATLDLAQERGMDRATTYLKNGYLSWEHLVAMGERITPDFSPSKLGRWLGWAQAAVVAANVGVTLEDVKQLNKAHANDTLAGIERRALLALLTPTPREVPAVSAEQVEATLSTEAWFGSGEEIGTLEQVILVPDAVRLILNMLHAANVPVEGGE